MQQNYYTVLGISYSASKQDIKKAFKKLAILYHPDKHQGNRYFEEKFKVVNEAYQVLSDERRKARYDMRLKQVLQQQQAKQQYNARYGHTREPASFAERHYMQRPQYRRPTAPPRPRFNRHWKKEVAITLGILLLIFMGSLMIERVMDNFAAKTNYKNALTEIQRQNYSKAHNLLVTALEFKPHYAEAFYLLGVLEMDRYNNCLTAIDHFSLAIEYAEEPLADAYYRRGACLSKLTAHAVAEVDLTTAIDMDKDLGKAYFSRGEIRLFYLDNYNGAIADFTSYLKKTSVLTEKNEGLYHRGFAYYQNGQYDEAIRDYETYLQTAPTNGRIHFLIGRAEYEKGNADLACRYFKKAYDLDYKASLGDLRQFCNDTTTAVTP